MPGPRGPGIRRSEGPTTVPRPPFGGVSGGEGLFLDGSALPATEVDGEWVAPWTATFGAGTATWKPGEVVIGTATLTVTSADGAHADTAGVTATGAVTGTRVSDDDGYHAIGQEYPVVTPPATPAGGLASTGADVTLAVGVGIGVLALGGLLFLIARRRRHE